MLRLDYLSCFLTIASTLMVGKRLWQGWLVAAANSVLICVIGFRTGQTGFIPANLFCLAMYAYNVMQWTSAAPKVTRIDDLGTEDAAAQRLSLIPTRTPPLYRHAPATPPRKIITFPGAARRREN